MIFPLLEADLGEKELALLVRFRFGPAVENQRQCDIFQRRQCREKIEKLKHEADFGAPEESDLVVSHLRNKALVYENVPAGRPVQSADQVKQGALPGAARSHDDGKLPFRYVERDPGQRRDFVLPLAIHFANVDAADHEARCFNR